MSLKSFFKVLLFFTTFISISYGALMNQNEIFNADIFPVPYLDPAGVYGAGQYIVLSHIVRPLTKLDKYAQIEGDLAESWRISNDHKTFLFKIKKDTKWSDGTPITSTDVKRSLDRQIKLNRANHFNFELISSIVVNNEREFTINLKQKNVLFIRQVSYPEFGVVSEQDSVSDFEKMTFKKVSGPYLLTKNNEREKYLEKNPNYPSTSPTAPSIVRFSSNDIGDKLNDILNGKADLIVPFNKISEDKFNQIIKSKNITVTYPHIGYTFWLVINPNSDQLKDLSLRHWIQKLVYNDQMNFNSETSQWEKANQLYLPDGLGRPTEDELKSIWTKIKKKAKQNKKRITLSLLTGTDNYFPYNDRLISLLKKYFNLKIDHCNNSKECKNMMLKKSYDLIIKANDFSSADLHENLQTTFNPNYSLILTDKEDGQFQNELKLALNTDKDDDRHLIYKNIAKKILEKGYIAPIAYHKVIFIHKKQIDISLWSTLYPELSLWKVSIGK